MPAWIETGFNEYTKRMPPELRIELREVKPEARSSSNNAATVMQREAARIEAVLGSLSKQCRIVALDERGKDWTTVQLAEQLTGWQREGGDVAFLIGGADGLDPALKARAHTVAHIEPDAAARHGARAAGRAALSCLVGHAESSVSSRLSHRA
jgi:23S rRNA (pseudouridine1915-N3)-methyltransferase